MYDFKPTRDKHGCWRHCSCKAIRKYKRNKIDPYVQRESMSPVRYNRYYRSWRARISWENTMGFLFSRLGRPVSEIIHELREQIKDKYLVEYSGVVEYFNHYLDGRRYRYWARTGLHIDDEGCLQWNPQGWSDPGIFKTSRAFSRVKKQWNIEHAQIPELTFSQDLGKKAPIYIGELWVEPLTDRRKGFKPKVTVPVYLVSSFKWCGEGYRDGKKYPKSVTQMKEYVRVGIPGIGVHIEKSTLNTPSPWYPNFYWYFVIKKKRYETERDKENN